jgi:hypothetical protein
MSLTVQGVSDLETLSKLIEVCLNEKKEIHNMDIPGWLTAYPYHFGWGYLSFQIEGEKLNVVLSFDPDSDIATSEMKLRIYGKILAATKPGANQKRLI